LGGGIATLKKNIRPPEFGSGGRFDFFQRQPLAAIG
jgi:hypothetical protein